MNKDRDNIKELLSAYIDGEVTQEQADSVKQAVAADPELALELHELRETRRLMMGLARQRAPRGFVRKVMVRAERKHLLGDHHAGGAFGAARWITFAVAAVVLLAAGIGIIAVNMIDTDQDQKLSPMANLDTNGRMFGEADDLESDGGPVHGKRGDSRDEEGGKARVDSVTVNSGTLGVDGGSLVVADAAFDYAVANAQNATIYTPNVTDTLAVLEETLYRNDVQPLELAEASLGDSEAEADDKPAGKASEKKRGVSRGGLNFYYNKKQDDEQVQIVVLATDTVIEQLNGDLDKLASVQEVSQASVADDFGGKGDAYSVLWTGPGRTQKDIRPEINGDGMTIAQGGDVTAGADPKADKELGAVSGRGSRSKKSASGWEEDVAKGAPKAPDPVPAPIRARAPSVATPAAPKITRPEDRAQIAAGEIVMLPPDVSSAEAPAPARRESKLLKVKAPPAVAAETNAPIKPVIVADSGLKRELVGKDDISTPMPKSKPAASRRTGYGLATRPAEPVLTDERGQQVLPGAGNSGVLKNLSGRIAAQQKGGKRGGQGLLDLEYSKLNNAFRQQILNDDLRRNVQSQREQGVNVQALIINLNRRSQNLRNAKSATSQSAATRRAIRALSRPRDAAASAPISGSTTQRAAQDSNTTK